MVHMFSRNLVRVTWRSFRSHVHTEQISKQIFTFFGTFSVVEVTHEMKIHLSIRSREEIGIMNTSRK